MSDPFKIELQIDDRGTVTLNTLKANFASLDSQVQKSHQNLQTWSSGLEKYGGAIKNMMITAGASFSAAGIFSMLDKAADMDEMTVAVDRLAKKFGTSQGSLVDMIQKGGEGMIGFATATKMAGEVMLKGFDPSTLGQFAKAAKTLSDFSGEKVADVFTKLVESITTGRERAIKGLVGIMELENKYTKEQIEGMTDLEKAHAKANMMFEKTAEIQKTLGGVMDTTADKIERQKVKMEDAARTFGKMMLNAAETGSDKAASFLGMVIDAGRYLITLPDKIGAPSWSAFTPQLAVSHGPAEMARRASVPSIAQSHATTSPDLAAAQATAKKVSDLAAVGSANWQKANEKILSSTQEVLKMYESYLGKSSNEYLALQETVKNTTIALEDQKLKSMFEQNLVFTKKVTQSELIEYARGSEGMKALGEKRYLEIGRMMGDLERARTAQRYAIEEKFRTDQKDYTLAAQTEINAIILDSWTKVNAMMMTSSERTAAGIKALYIGATAAEEAAAAEVLARQSGTMFPTEGGLVKWSTDTQGGAGFAPAGIYNLTGIRPGEGTSVNSLYGVDMSKLVLGKFAAGTDYVPRTGLYHLDQGEKVVPAARNDGGGTSITVNNYISGINNPEQLADALVRPIELRLKKIRSWTG